MMAGRLNYVVDDSGKAINPVDNTLDIQPEAVSLLHPDIDLDDIPEVGEDDLD
jgi:hypothetical protein